MKPIWAVVLAGGVGARFWPLSTPQRPKQLLPLVNDAPLLVNTLERLLPLVPRNRTIILTAETLVSAVHAAARAHNLDLAAENIVPEPRSVGTLAPLVWAAAEIVKRSGADAVMASMYSDWAIEDPAEFRRTIAHAADAATKNDALITVGIAPTRPDPGLGYLVPGANAGNGLFRVDQVIEKPDRARAAQLIAEGYLWNSGILVCRPAVLLAEAQRHAPNILRSLEDASHDIAQFFLTVAPGTFEGEVLTKSDRLLVLPGRFGWDDVGTWASVTRIRDVDEAGNSISGTVHLHDASGNVVHADGNAVIMFGVSDLIVVTRNGLTFVAAMARTDDLKSLLNTLPASLRELAEGAGT